MNRSNFIKTLLGSAAGLICSKFIKFAPKEISTNIVKVYHSLQKTGRHNFWISKNKEGYLIHYINEHGHEITFQKNE